MVAGVPVPPAGKVDAPLARSPHDRKKMAVSSSQRAKRAVTHYRLIERLKGAAMVECRLATGRTHQVRVHMASICHPLLGDPLYSRVRAGTRELLERLGFRRHAPPATHTGFSHPVKG